MAIERLHGGPWDGGHVNTSLRVEFLWCDGRRCYVKRAKGRELYRRMRNRDGDLVLIYATHLFVQCECGVYHRRGSRTCTLCGDDIAGR
jgi:hypothetical protein